MKLLRNGLAAIVAILTISVTIAAHAGTFNSSKLDSGTCDPTVDVIAADFLKSDCTPLTTAICNATLPVYIDNPTYQVEEQFICEGPTLEFCCAEVVADNHCPSTDQLRVTKIICGERP